MLNYFGRSSYKSIFYMPRYLIKYISKRHYQGCKSKYSFNPYANFTNNSIKFQELYLNTHVRFNHNLSRSNLVKKRSTRNYIVAVGVLAIGVSYAAVPLYRIFCQAYSYGGTTQKEDSSEGKVLSLKKRPDKEIKIVFNADTAASMQWNFKPQQNEIIIIPGETALAFYSAKNPTSRPVVGISTYNVIPFEAGQYFNKIQCFCFEEQILNPGEEVSMPVFFYIDPEIVDDPKMEYLDDIILSYTFFEVKDNMNIPLPGFMQKR